MNRGVNPPRWCRGNDQRPLVARRPVRRTEAARAGRTFSCTRLGSSRCPTARRKSPLANVRRRRQLGFAALMSTSRATAMPASWLLVRTPASTAWCWGIADQQHSVVRLETREERVPLRGSPDWIVEHVESPRVGRCRVASVVWVRASSGLASFCAARPWAPVLPPHTVSLRRVTHGRGVVVSPRPPRPPGHDRSRSRRSRRSRRAGAVSAVLARSRGAFSHESARVGLLPRASPDRRLEPIIAGV